MKKLYNLRKQNKPMYFFAGVVMLWVAYRLYKHSRTEVKSNEVSELEAKYKVLLAQQELHLLEMRRKYLEAVSQKPQKDELAERVALDTINQYQRAIAVVDSLMESQQFSESDKAKIMGVIEGQPNENT